MDFTCTPRDEQGRIAKTCRGCAGYLYQIAPATFTKLRRNQEMALSVLLKIADVLDCDVGDMLSFVKDDVLCSKETNEGHTLDTLQ